MPDPAAPGRNAAPNLTDYERERETFALTVPARYNPVSEIVEGWAKDAPDDLALISLGPDGETVAEQTIAQVALQSRRVARALLELGIGKGDPVLIVLPRIPEWYAVMLGVIRIGAVALPGTNQLTARDISYRIGASEAVAIVTDAGGVAKVDAITDEPPSLATKISVAAGDRAGWVDLAAISEAVGDGATPPDPTAKDDPMIIFFTSGTVSYPKMVLQPQSYGQGHVTTARFWHDLRSGDRHWTVTDTGWAKAAWGGLFGQWHERVTIVQVALGKPTADRVLSIIGEQRITSFCAPPTLYRLLVQSDLATYDLGALRHCTSAGEPLNPEVIRAWKQGTGLLIYDGYGQSETSVLVANYRTLEVRPGSMGKPVPGWDVEIIDEQSGERAADETVGNIAVRVTEQRPIGLFDGYYRDPKADEKAFHDGWYFTGDKAWRDADGYLWFEGRADDVITSSAYRIGPFEVESALIEHPAVTEAAVVGKNDPMRTQIVTAFIVLSTGYEDTPELAADLQAHTRALTAPYKYPREIHFVAELPKTVSGKIRRSQLREQLNGAGDSAG